MASLNMIVAVNKTGGIGFENQIPWHEPEDLKHFKAVTMNSVLIMGRKTFASLPKVLPGRLHVVVSKTVPPTQNTDQVVYVSTYQIAVRTASLLVDKPEYSQIFVIGGKSAYENLAAYVDKLYLTRVQLNTQQDTELDLSLFKSWKLVSEVPTITENKTKLIFQIWINPNPISEEPTC
uniref:Dihydrofolate reductase type 9 n=1 Tax=Escherichia coli TaxID=562 RepID=DYR9_ECOLX|nr:trimethoprim-resistant dihydrofolate reductase DfrA9 [Escherichia coli]Q59397.1 RecName: Full=Dihydrofolate reductase type 9; AltName: Full=Dihydrofolate reductase type IX [Escherichia coli]CAA40897.1 dihydrofolate reductase [Escherichia coli]